MDSPGVLEARGLALYRGRRRVYENLSLTLEIGITALLGPNGAGKTTLIDGLLTPQRARSGNVVFEGRVVRAGASLRRFHRRIGHMPQGWQHFPGFTAKESVEYVAWLKGIPNAQVTAAALHALTLVDLVNEADVRVGKMSGGTRQRVGLAEAIVNEPSLVLLDEPTVGLDPAQRASFRHLLRAHSDQRAILISTHLTDDVQAMADRVLVVDRGSIVFDGSPELLASYASDGNGSSALESGYLAIVGGLEAARSS